MNSTPIPIPAAPAPDILRCAYMELVVTDLEKSRWFYVEVLGLVVTEEDENSIYLRSFEEFIHHNLVLRKGDVAAVAAERLGFGVAHRQQHILVFLGLFGDLLQARSHNRTLRSGSSAAFQMSNVHCLRFSAGTWHETL